MGLADSSNRRIAGHLSESFDVVRDQQGANTHAGSSERCLGTCMATAHHDDVVCFREDHDESDE